MSTLTPDQQRLVIDNIPLAEQIAIKFSHCIDSDLIEKSITLDDLKQESLLGLCEAAARFDTTLGIDFTPMAYVWCRRLVTCALSKYGTPLSVHSSFDQPIELLHLDAELDNPTESKDDDGEHIDTILYALASEAHAEQQARQYNHQRVARMLRGLNPNERKVICYLYGLDNQAFTVGQVARMLRLSPRRVLDIKHTAERKMEQQEA